MIPLHEGVTHFLFLSICVLLVAVLVFGLIFVYGRSPERTRFQKITDSFEEPVLICNEGGEILFTNNSFAELDESDKSLKKHLSSINYQDLSTGKIFNITTPQNKAYNLVPLKLLNANEEDIHSDEELFLVMIDNEDIS